MYLYFNDFCQVSYLKIYQTDLHQIFRFGITVSVCDDQSEIAYSIHQGTIMATIFVVAGRRRLVAQPGVLTLGFALQLCSS